jgi:asparagine synthase (glutamine-hydrolysing)
MCAIAGGVALKNADTLGQMLACMAHRGPDDTGMYEDKERDIALGHQRLSIIDLSSAGHQPMTSSDGSLVIVFNGEIYNYHELRSQLQEHGHVFHSMSDTEVILTGYAEWGADIFKKIDGMWALALYDIRAGTLLLSRDPAGIKPLYVYQDETTLLFASEIGALASVLPAGARTIRDASIDRFLAHGYLYGTETVYEHINSLAAGYVRTYTLPALAVTEESIYTPRKRFTVAGMDDAVKQFNELFSASVCATLQSDVPVGLFLSGGIDSALTGYHIKEAGAKLTAFTVGFAEQSFDESPAAARIAQHLGFPHVTHMMSGSDVADDVEHILDSFGQPFADTSALPTYYLSKLAREAGVKVALDGSGADELFGGYQTHYLPPFAEAYRHTPAGFDAIQHAGARLLPARATKLGSREKLTRFANAARNPYRRAHAHWKRVFTEKEFERVLTPEARAAARAVDTEFDSFFAQVAPSSQNPADEVMKVDFLTFLPASCLVKSDIVSMQHGLEIRVPFLNKDLIDFAWYLPTQYKVGLFATKRLLRRALADYLPADIVRMKKQGFVPPLALWLAGELKPAMLRILSPEHIARVEFLEYKYIGSLIDDHLAQRADHSKKLWALMSLVRFLNHASA